MNSESEYVIDVPRKAVYFKSSGIDFVEAAEAHMQWRSRLQRHIDGVTTEEWLPSAAGADDCCGLGRWLRGVGRVKFGHFSSFRHLDAEHAEFHGFAGMVLEKVREGSRNEAENLLKNEFSQATRRILIAMNELNDAMSVM